MPALGDSINIRLFLKKAEEPEISLECTFEGFEPDRILFKQKGRTALSDAPLSLVTKIAGSRNNIISGETIQRLILEGKIPVLSVIVVKGEAGKTLVAMDIVSRIEKIPVKKHDSALTGFLIGATIDAVVVAVVVDAWRDALRDSLKGMAFGAE